MCICICVTDDICVTETKKMLNCFILIRSRFSQLVVYSVKALTTTYNKQHTYIPAIFYNFTLLGFLSIPVLWAV